LAMAVRMRDSMRTNALVSCSPSLARDTISSSRT
jgi:hypothetical protein